MSDSSDDQAVDRADTDGGAEAGGDGGATTDTQSAAGAEGPSDSTAADDLDALREQVDEKYDFDNFGPADMAEMSAEEWEAAFDADSWITGPELLDRLETDLKNKIASRDVFGVIERETVDGVDRLLVYSDEGYVTVAPDGSVEGEGGILRDVEPMVALCSMEEYEIDDPPENYQLPSPEAVPEQTGELGNLMIQLIAGMQLLGGLGLIGAWIVTDIGLVAPVIGGLFLAVGFFLFSLVANARLSDRFRAEQYRNRLEAVETGGFERPAGIDDHEPAAEIDGGEQADSGGEPDAESTARDAS
ncbi:DUF7319 domain-containing protein [Halohasta litorea]|uniref:DUF7319 domain-containing protein n=1 Tax=Halohasta litorea TaxID=869891 RepID=A0ABD6D7D7_9EURY|nr:hypothetical protein [Halohasta litorea]